MRLRYSFHFPFQWVMQTTIGGMLLVHLKATSNTLTTTQAGFVVFLVCLFVMAFAWSWGPLGWLIPSETFPLETRTAGFAFAVSSNMFFTFLIAQAFLSMMCHMRAYIFFFFAGWILVMGLFALFLLPETKGVPIDVMVERVWKKHPVWKRFMDDWWWEWQVKANRLVYLDFGDKYNFIFLFYYQFVFSLGCCFLCSFSVYWFGGFAGLEDNSKNKPVIMTRTLVWKKNKNIWAFPICFHYDSYCWVFKQCYRFLYC